MNFDLHNALSRLASIEKLSETAVSECGEMPATPPSTINISISASGENNIKSMLQMLNQLSSEPEPSVVTTEPVPLSIDPIDASSDSFNAPTPCELAANGDMPSVKVPMFNSDENAAGFGDTDSEPKPEIDGVDYMNNTLAGGMNKPKDSYPRVSPGDNPMQYKASESFKESIRVELQKRLNEIKNR